MAKEKEQPNQGYIHPMVCGSCLKLWVDSELAELEEESIILFGRSVSVRECPRCLGRSIVRPDNQ